MQDVKRFGPNCRLYGLLAIVFILIILGVITLAGVRLEGLMFILAFPIVTFAYLYYAQNILELYPEYISQHFLWPWRESTHIDIANIEWLALNKRGITWSGQKLVFQTDVLIKLKDGQMAKIPLTQLNRNSEAEAFFRQLIRQMVVHDTELVSLKDFHGVSQLAKDATLGLTDLVEAVQQNLTRLPGLTNTPVEKGISGLTRSVFNSIRSITGLTGAGVDGLLAQLSPLLVKKVSLDKLSPITPERAAVLSALNGVLGDYLAATRNTMTQTMRLRCNGRSLELTSEALKDEISHLGGRVLILVHGLCMNDLQWNRQGHDHGAALAHDLGYTSLYLRYNSGQHISTNGRAFADLLEVLLKVWPVPVKELVLMGHSMGGLVSRSACHYGRIAGHSWLKKTRKLICLGSPHHGAPLERGGNWVDVILGSSPYTAPFARIGKVRSSGITDLRYGNVIDEHWHGRDRFERASDSRLPVPLPTGIQCYAIAGTTGKKVGDARDKLLGDGLVKVDSALGKHNDASLTLSFPEEHQWLAYGCHHMDLLNDSDVYMKIKEWLI